MTAEKRNEVTISGGSFTGVTVVGQHNTTTTGAVLAGADRDETLAQLRELVSTLRAELEQAAGGTNEVKAGVHADNLADELAAAEPDSGRVRKIWNQLQGLLTAAQFGAQFGTHLATISQVISKLF